MEVSMVMELAVVSNGDHGEAGIYAKLPKLELRKFFGKVHRLWDSFRVSVENNKTLGPALKLEYLKTQCEGSAYQAIAGLELSDANYQIAVDILKGRLGQRQIILNSPIDALLKINAVKSGDVIILRKIYDAIEIHWRGLQSLGVDPKAYGTVLVNLLLQKLPEEVQLIVSRKLNEEYKDKDATESDWELSKHTEFLKTELEEGKNATRVIKGNPPLQRKYATAAALVTGDGKTNCTFCRVKHGTSYCHVITDINEHKRILRKAGRCFPCLCKAGHLARDCHSLIRCFCCKGHHHIALCGKNIKFAGSQPDGESKRG